MRVREQPYIRARNSFDDIEPFRRQLQADEEFLLDVVLQVTSVNRQEKRNYKI